VECLDVIVIWPHDIPMTNAQQMMTVGVVSESLAD